MNTRQQIAKLKKEARKYYRQYNAATAHFSCGKALAEYISSDASEAKRNFNETMDQLAKVDPTTPKGRL